MDRRTLHQAMLLRAAGLGVSIISPLGDSPVPLEGVRLVHDTPSPTINDEIRARGAARLEAARLARNVAAEILSSGCGLVSIARPPETGLLAARVARFLRKPLIVDYRLPGPEALLERGGLSDSPAYRAALRNEHQFLARADLVLCPSPAIERLVGARGGLPPERMVLLRDGQEAASTPAAPHGTDWRQSRKHLVVYAGPLTRYAGIDVFVRAARRIVYGLDIATIQFVIAGEGPHRQALQELIVAEGLRDFVTLTGGEDAGVVAGLLAGADAAVDPLPSSPLGKLLPAVALTNYVQQGVPAIAFDRGVPREYPLDAVHLVRKADIPGLAEAILQVIEAKPVKARDAVSALHAWRGDAGPVYASLIQRILATHLPATGEGSIAAL
jgi:glycosyltransferase involved in cell wall biosynthesis